ALEHVMEGVDMDAELFAQTRQHYDLVGAVAVRVDIHLALQDVGQCLECQIAPGSERVFPALPGGLILIPLLDVFATLCEGFADRLFDAHSSGREATLCAWDVGHV